MQEGWLFENAVRGVAVRQNFAGEDCGCDHRTHQTHEACPAVDDSTPEGCTGSHVFIVEGEQERYGDKSAWGGYELGF